MTAVPAVGSMVYDRESVAESPAVGLVVRVRDAPASDVHIDALDESVADVNPDYPRDDPVVDIAFADQLDDAIGAGTWRQWDAETVGYDFGMWEAAHGSFPTYSYPVSRLAPVGTLDSAGGVIGVFTQRARRAMTRGRRGRANPANPGGPEEPPDDTD